VVAWSLIVRAHSRLWSAVACHGFSSYPTLFTLSLEGPPSATVRRSSPSASVNSVPSVTSVLILIPAFDLQLSTVNFQPPLVRHPSNSHGITSFADPHPLTPAESYRSKNRMGRGACFQRPGASTFRLRPRRKSFRRNTYRPSHKCCKQKTYGIANSFRCNTYEKQGEGSHPSSKNFLRSALYFLTSLPRYILASFHPYFIPTQ
jgi:hypothetical protein